VQQEVSLDNAIMSTHRALVRSRARDLAKEGLSLSQFEVLRVVVDRGPVPMRILSREMLVTPPNITGLVDRLEKRSLLRRVADTKDRRASIIELTSAGKNLYTVLAARQRRFLQNVLGTLTSDEQKTLSTLLSRLRYEILGREKNGQ
jgi:DNA-binding MarR family transcriptional regulator